MKFHSPAGLLDSTHKTYFPQPAGGFGSLGQTFESSPRVVLDAGDRCSPWEARVLGPPSDMVERTNLITPNRGSQAI